jgi:hypothetical protein
MALQFTTTDQASVGHGIKMLVYGPAGHGKTVLASTLPDPLILSAEAGLLSIRHKKIPVIVIKTYQDLLDAYTWVLTSPHAAAFKSIVLDSVSEIAEVILNFAKANAKDPRQAYGTMNDQVTQLIRNFRDIQGKHILFTAKQDREKDEKTGFLMYGPGMPGKQLTQGIDHFFDEVFYMGIGELPDKSTYRFLRTRPDNQYRAKDRSDALDEFEEPDLTKVINKIVSKK